MNHTKKQLVERFDEASSAYDSQRRKLIPCFDDFYQIAVSLTDEGNDAPSILDLGAGTGLFSAFMLQKHPRAKLTLVDLSGSMLEVARTRFSGVPNVTYMVGDYTTCEYREKYDIVISSLSIHHLADVEKQKVYRTAYALLNDNGLFINADQVLGDTPALEERYKQDWRRKVESSGLSAGEISSAYERTKLDRMSTLEEQLVWLKQAGFSDVDCIYKYFNFVVMAGWKKDMEK
ncbi:class I SAM-dependent methyltransferase [Paenibacillus tyrfis]|uniref:class I SAM-dependent methyltransferase n=1 Tax=Paenibacillus tyrfis TaxID=1501230 RepID=UPI00209F4FEB|nr:class I SAM-dependent methyltransferase [Paenibacillus tyrfis]MCP1307474.1 class I SAM-dependent methyltransferase [Paenibacillus tyrfis]